MTNPNIQNDPATKETIDRVKSAAQKVLVIAGVERKDGTMQSAVLGLEYSSLTDHPEKALPTISINKAIGEFARTAMWDYEVSIGAQDENASRHALFLRDEDTPPEIGFYNGQPDRQMTELEALAIATDLERVAKPQSGQ